MFLGKDDTFESVFLSEKMDLQVHTNFSLIKLIVLWFHSESNYETQTTPRLTLSSPTRPCTIVNTIIVTQHPLMWLTLGDIHSSQLIVFGWFFFLTRDIHKLF